jgi:hypothetical protein
MNLDNEYNSVPDDLVAVMTLTYIIRGLVRLYLTKEITLNEFSESIAALPESHADTATLVINEIERYYEEKALRRK